MRIGCHLRRFSTAWVIVAVVSATPLHAEPSPTSDETRLMEADRAFAAATAERGAEGWASFFLSDGVMFPREGKVAGREAIEAFMREGMGPQAPSLEWEPVEAVLAGSGELGWTLGRWRLVGDPGGSEPKVLRSGNYVTLWRKDDEGSWKVAVDIGNDDETASVSAPDRAAASATAPSDTGTSSSGDEPDWERLRGPARFPEVDWLVGEWQGYGVFEDRTTWLHKSWSYDVGGVFLHERTLDVFPPDTLSTEFEIHQDTALWYRDTDSGALRSVTFFVEGYVTTAEVKVEEDGWSYIVDSTRIENAPPGMATRFTVRRVEANELEERFEIRFPGRDWVEMERLTLRRVHEGGSR